MFFKTLSATPLVALLFSLLFSNTVAAESLKPTMKEMRLYYKQAIDAQDPTTFNGKIAQFLTELQTARAYNFSPERKALSLEGLNKVHRLISTLPVATEANLTHLQNQLQEADQLRVEYHKKVKPSVFELLLDTLKQSLGF